MFETTEGGCPGGCLSYDSLGVVRSHSSVLRNRSIRNFDPLMADSVGSGGKQRAGSQSRV